MGPFIRVVVAFVTTLVAGVAGYLLVDTSSSGWYASLIKPSLAPPDTVFITIWFALYVCMALSLSLIWAIHPQTESTAGWIRFYFVQLLFTVAWILFFFKLHALLVALIAILILGFIVIALIAAAADLDRRAAYLLTPCFLWIAFSGYLTLRIWLLN